jgi:hypothetical protein
MKIQSQRNNLFDTSNTGNARLEGLMIAMIEWWIQYHALDEDLRKTADGCDFSHMQLQKDDNIGRIVLQNSNYWKRFLNDVNRDPAMALMMKIVMEPSEDNFHPSFVQTVHSGSIQSAIDSVVERITSSFHYRFENAIGYRLFVIGWWKENEKRIKKERANFKAVAKIHAS